jgi:hypothetical protein
MAVFMIGPMLTAAALFTLARREQLEVERVLAERAELSPVSAVATR